MVLFLWRTDVAEILKFLVHFVTPFLISSLLAVGLCKIYNLINWLILDAFMLPFSYSGLLKVFKSISISNSTHWPAVMVCTTRILDMFSWINSWNPGTTFWMLNLYVSSENKYKWSEEMINMPNLWFQEWTGEEYFGVASASANLGMHIHILWHHCLLNLCISQCDLVALQYHAAVYTLQHRG